MSSAPVTATQLHAHLQCPHRVAMDAFGDATQRDAVSPFVQLLWERGVAHEHDVVAGLGASFTDLSSLRGAEKETATRAALARGDALIHGGRLSVHGLLGEPDLLRREGGGYVAIDIKSGVAGQGDEPGHPHPAWGVQLALYTDILERLGLSAGRFGYILDLHRVETRCDLDRPLGPRSACLWELYLRARQGVTATLADPASSQPALCTACKLCVWRSACLSRLEAANDLSLLPELGRGARDVLQGEFPTVAALAAADIETYIAGDDTPFPGVGARSLRRFHRRAQLACAAHPQPFLTRAIAWPRRDVELYFDVEADPLRDLCYLHGFLIRERDATGQWQERFESVFSASADAAGERHAFAAAMAIFRRHPQALVLHYTRYERTTYRRLAARHAGIVTPAEIEALFAPPRALDLYTDVVRPASEWPTRDFSIKRLAQYLGFAWRDVDPSGASSVEWFERWAQGGDPALRQRLIDYNEDDCRAMRVLHEALRKLPVREP